MLETLRIGIQKSQKKGIHFILTSVIIWLIIAVIHLSSFQIEFRNLLTFSSSALLLPISWFISKRLNINFSDKENPLSSLGLVFSLNQFLYLLIVMWVYNAHPEKMVFAYGIVYGAHLLPYGWLYDSRAYYVMSVVITLASFIVGLMITPANLAFCLVGLNLIFSIWLWFEVKQLERV